jgi:hypothetical protein
MTTEELIWCGISWHKNVKTEYKNHDISMENKILKIFVHFLPSHVLT